MRPKMPCRSNLLPAGAVLSALLLSAAFVCSGAFVCSAAAAIRVLGTGGPDDPPSVRVLSERPDGLTLEFTMPSLVVEEVNAAGQVFQSLAIPRGGVTGEIGQPMLPAFSRFVAVPPASGVQVLSTVEDEEELTGFRLIPNQSDEGTEFAYDLAAYSRADYGDAPTASVGEPAVLRCLRLVPLEIRPVRYNPAQGTLRVARRVRIEVTFAGQDPVNALAPDTRPIASSFDRLYRELVVNYGTLEGQREVRPGAWLLICPNDNGVVTRLQPLVNWRQRKGLTTVVATTAQTGTSTSQIKAYIQTAYDTWPVPPEYVVLAGDGDGSYAIPTWRESLSGYSGEGDHPYTLLAGGDVLSDVHVGRLSFSNFTELEVIVNKTVGYESTPYLQDPGWFRRACLVGDPSQSGYSTVQVMQWVKTRLREIGYTQVDTVFGGSFVSQMSAALNRGDTIFSYRGYLGMSGWSNGNTYALTNGWKMPFAVISTCGTGSFVGGTCLSEGFLRANSGATSPKGAIAAIGTATTGTHTRFNNCYTFGVLGSLLYEQVYAMGAAHTRGKYELYLDYFNSPQSNYVTIFSHWNNLMGDPAAECWTAYPDPMAVTHPSSIALGANSVTVSATEAGGAPAQGAQVCLWKGTETYAVGSTDAQGVCELPVTLISAGNLLLTVTKHDRYPYQATIPVAGQAAYVGYQASSVDDDNSGLSHGNGDGQINPGETIEFSVQLRNFGSQPAAGVTARLTSGDPYLTVTEADVSYGDIPAGGTAWSSNPYLFTVAPDCPHEHILRLGLEVHSGSSQWHSLVELQATSADLQATGVDLFNAGPNGLLDPGETVEVTVDLKNFGGIGATALTGTLLSQSEFLDVPDPSGTFSDIPPGGAGDNFGDKFAVHASSRAYRGYLAHLKLALQFSGGVRDTLDLTIPIGSRGTVDPTGPDRYGYYAFDNTDIAYPEAPAYNWVEIDPALGGDGTEIPLGDYADYQDKTATVPLPFPFQYYGTAYAQASVCSNGWIVMGSTYLTDYRNWTLPSMGGPNGVIAAFWDDLYQASGTSRVLQKYDAANHRWIVEWSRMRNSVGGATETFEILFYDPAYYPTDSGDGEIVFQYNVVNNLDSTDGYATVGIEKPDNSDGLLYSYFNIGAPGAASLAAGRSIRFLPVVETLTGQIRGSVRNQAGNGPLAGATVTVLQNGHQYQTGPDGGYQGTELGGEYSLAAGREGFAPDTVLNVHVVQGGVVTVDFLLRDIQPPSIVYPVRIASTSDSLGPYPVTATVTDMSAITALVYYRTFDGAFRELPMTQQSLSVYRADIPGQKWTTEVQYYILARDGAGNVATLPPGAPSELYTFWVAPLRTAFFDDLEGADQGWTAGVAGDDAVSGIWERCDPNGTDDGQGHMVQPEDDHTPPSGVQCFVTGQSPPGADQDLNDVDGGTTTLLTPPVQLALNGTALLRYWRWYTNDTGGNPGEDSWVVQASGDGGQTWAVLENTNVSERSWRQMEFNLGDFIPVDGQVQVRFIARDLNGPSIVEAAVDDIEIVYFGLTPSSVVGSERLRFGLAAGLPNPMRPGSQIRFTLDRSGEASLIVFDVQGRAVRRLTEGILQPGSYAVGWDGRDDGGRVLSAGVYFYRLQSGKAVQTRKTLLVR